MRHTFLDGPALSNKAMLDSNKKFGMDVNMSTFFPAVAAFSSAVFVKYAFDSFSNSLNECQYNYIAK